MNNSTIFHMASRYNKDIYYTITDCVDVSPYVVAKLAILTRGINGNYHWVWYATLCYL